MLASTEFFRLELISIKQCALRKRVWFGTLDRVERGVVDITLRITDRIRSPVLIRVLLKIVLKLRDALESKFLKTAEEIGYDIARKSTELAYTWGSHEAKDWRSELHFIRYLGIMHLNTPTLFRV